MFARPSYTPPKQTPVPSLTQEKDEAINRILYDGDDKGARERLEERRKKRRVEKASAHTSFPSFFTQEPKEAKPAPAPVYTAPEAQPPAPIPTPATEQKPRRSFSNEFVFGDKPKSVFISEGQPPPTVQEYETPAPEYAATPVPPPANADSAFGYADPAAEPPLFRSFEPEDQLHPAAHEAPVAPVPQDAAFFALKPSDEEQAKFDVDKKNEEFQELLDKEFERLKNRETQAQDIRSQIEPEAPFLPGAEDLAVSDSASYIEERIEEFLKKSDMEMTREMRSHTPAPLSHGADPVRPEPSEISYADLEVFEVAEKPGLAERARLEPPDVLPATHAASREPGVAAVRVPVSALGEGFPFDGKDYGHAFLHGEKPLSDFDADKIAYKSQEAESDPEGEMLRAGEPNLEFAREAPSGLPAAVQPVSYADFEQYGFAEAPEAGEEVLPATTEAPSPSPAITESAPTPWGASRNEAPTRASVAAFLDRPIDFPFDETPVQGASASADFDFEPIVPAEEAPLPSAFAQPEPIEALTPAAAEASAPIPLPIMEETPTFVPEANIETPAPATPFAAPDFGTAGFAMPFAAPDAAEASFAAPGFEAAPFMVPDFDVTAFAAPFATEEAEEITIPLAEGAPSPAIEESAVLAEPSAFADPVAAGQSFAPATEEAPAPAAPPAPEFIVPAVAEEPIGAFDQDGPPSFFTAYTQGISEAEPETPATEMPATEAAPTEELPAFLTAYDDEPLGKAEGAEAAENIGQNDPIPTIKQQQRKANKSSKSSKSSNAKTTALSIVITILIIILVIVVVCIAMLKLSPTSLGAHYVQDAIEIIQEKLGIGGSAGVGFPASVLFWPYL
ncbi:MAG: hypothetical protein LBS91_09980 [Clostridiales Family XIII bacterium]|nr:hypothetical protein [Clostridiales Family XIII bacterium]